MEGILKNYLVIELAGVLAGPSAGQFLAELGAEVIKIENPRTQGDITRQWITPGEDAKEGISAYFSSINWGKKSLAVDLTHPEGRKIIYTLMKKADIVISSYKYGDDIKLGMDEPTLRAINKQLIFAHISGYGPTNSRVAFDAVMQAESGLMSMNGTPESGPLKMPIPVIDILAAHQLKEGILAALIKRFQTNEGNLVEVSLQDAALIALANQATGYLYTGNEPILQGSLHPTIAPYGETFNTLDGREIILAIGTNKQFAALCRMIQLPELSDNPLYETNKKRVENRRLLADQIRKSIENLTSTFLAAEAKKENIPLGVVHKVSEAIRNANSVIYQQKDFFGLRQNVFGSTKQSLSPPPFVGESTKSILEGLNYSENQISNMYERRIIS